MLEAPTFPIARRGRCGFDSPARPLPVCWVDFAALREWQKFKRLIMTNPTTPAPIVSARQACDILDATLRMPPGTARDAAKFFAAGWVAPLNPWDPDGVKLARNFNNLARRFTRQVVFPRQSRTRSSLQ